MKEKIVLGLSGGVDSAVAARLLQERYEVTGLYLDIGLGGTGAADAAAVAERLGIPFETADIRAELEREVCAPFAADYRAGRTPLPCARCNPAVKFPALFALAGRIGARYVSTGHYARVENGVLKKGMPANDQSYMLARLTREQLQKVIFPLGDYEKNQVRALARGFGIPVADKPDSMEICFIPDGDYAAFIEGRGLAGKEGHFIAPDGADLGPHKGVLRYTLGQRKGLGLALGKPAFVKAIRENGDVALGWAGEEFFGGMRLSDVCTPDGAPLPAGHYEVKVRSAAAPVGCTFDGETLVRFDEPARAPAPGQSAVFYNGDAVVGGGFIAEALD